MPKTDTPLPELDCILAQLRHGYMLLVNGYVTDTREFARGLIAPQIRRLEKLQYDERPCTCDGGPQGEGCVSIPHEPHCPRVGLTT